MTSPRTVERIDIRLRRYAVRLRLLAWSERLALTDREHDTLSNLSLLLKEGEVACVRGATNAHKTVTRIANTHQCLHVCLGKMRDKSLGQNNHGHNETGRDK